MFCEKSGNGNALRGDVKKLKKSSLSDVNVKSFSHYFLMWH